MNFFNFNFFEIQQQVRSFLLQNGIIPFNPDLPIISDGRIHRFRTQDDHPSDKSGAYCIFAEAWPAGWVQDWRNGRPISWSFPREALNDDAKSFFDNNRYREALEISKKRQQQLLLEIQQKKLQASENARIHFEHAQPAPQNHPYLQKKNVLALGLRYSEGKLVVPLCDVDGRFLSLQWIDNDGNKMFFPEAPTKAAFYSVALDCINPNQPILITEGYATMATVYELTLLPSVAAMNCNNLFHVAEALKKKFPDNKIIFLADNDFRNERNSGILAAQEACRKLSLHGVIYPEFDINDYGSDWNDFARIYGEDKTKLILQKKIRFCCLPKSRQELASRVDELNAEELRHTNFPPIKWAVDGFLPSGCTILAGSPKVGKSILALHLAIGVAIGGCVLGKIDVQQGDVLYLALEDNKRRLKERIIGSDLPDDVTLECLTLTTQVPRQHEGGIDYLEWWLEEHTNARLIIIDTLQKFRKLLSGKGSMYAEDYEAISQIKAVADKWNVPILIIHHLKKAKENDDWLNEFSGSQGIAGSADTLFALKRARTDNHAILHRTGRDVEEKDFSMRIDRFGWVLEGEAELFTMPEWKRQILDYLKEHDSVTAVDLASALNMNPSTTRNNLVRLLKEGVLVKEGYGIYKLANKEK